jgi:hypothetical protein
VHAAGLFDNKHNAPFAAFRGLHKVYPLSKITALVTKLDCKVSIHDLPNKHITTSELSIRIIARGNGRLLTARKNKSKIRN